jgi:hypothetical protein
MSILQDRHQGQQASDFEIVYQRIRPSQREVLLRMTLLNSLKLAILTVFTTTVMVTAVVKQRQPLHAFQRKPKRVRNNLQSAFDPHHPSYYLGKGLGNQDSVAGF